MKYYVVADPHGYFTILKNTLEEAGFFSDPLPHKLLVLGDLLDRGREAVKMQAFVQDLFQKGEIVFIRGNHEDLMMEMIARYSVYRMDILRGLRCIHLLNGTFDTALQLTGFSYDDALRCPDAFIDELKKTPFVSELIPKSVDYLETGRYVFTHGYVPLFPSATEKKEWRRAEPAAWESARWLNGMETAAVHGLTVPEKTVVCGHWTAAYGHSVLEGKGSEHGENADFSPYFGEGVIGLDACTAYSGKINCLVIEDE